MVIFFGAASFEQTQLSLFFISTTFGQFGKIAIDCTGISEYKSRTNPLS